MFDWFFDPATSRTLLTTTLGSLAALASAFIASQNVSRTIKNQNKGLPPEILRIEKIQSIIIEHKSSEHLNKINISDLEGEYEKSLRRLFLESKLANLGIQDGFARQKILNISEKIEDNSSFPDLTKVSGSRIDSFVKYLGYLIIIPSAMGIAISILAIGPILYAYRNFYHENSQLLFTEIIPSWLTIVATCLSLLYLSNIFINRWSLPDIETDLIVRNIYQHNSEYFTGTDKVITEDKTELKKRIAFENSKKFKKWAKNNPQKTSWDYGFNSVESGRKDIKEKALPKGFEIKSKSLILRREFPFISKGVRIQKVRNHKHNK